MSYLIFFSHVGTYSWVEPVLSHEDEDSLFIRLSVPVNFSVSLRLLSGFNQY